MKNNLIKNWVTFILALTMLLGLMSATSFASTSDAGDKVTVTNGKTFTLRKDYYELLTNHSSYGTKDYIAYPWEGNFYIWFFKDDLTNVKFSMWDRGSGRFGLYPSQNVTFTEYVYDMNTLEFTKSWDRTIDTSNYYMYSYDFIASFNIYTDKNYTTYFYETEESQTLNPQPPVEDEDIKNITNGKTFTLRKDYYELLTNHSLYGTKDYIAYPWEGNFYIWFFKDDLTNVKFSMWDRGTGKFGLYPSQNVSFTEYVYDMNTLKFIKSWDRTIDTSNYYMYSYDFMASFNIYTDKNYSTYFYEIKDSVETPDKPLVKFEPLSPDDAKDFLKFVANAKELVNIEEELPVYYDFLTGEIQDSNEELRAKVSFLTYLYYCLDAQVAQNNERINMGTTYLIDWIGANTEVSNIIYSEIKSSLVDSLKNTIAQNSSIPAMEIAGVNIVTAVVDYGDLFIVSLNSFDAIRSTQEIQYLLAYKYLLETKETNIESSILYAESVCNSITLNMSFGGNIEEMQKYAGYLFNIEQSLPK